MPDAAKLVQSFGDLCKFVQRMLCQREDLLEDQFHFEAVPLAVQDRDCGYHFSLHGPRNVRLSAIWDAAQNKVYFYDSCGNRFETIGLVHPLEVSRQLAA